MEGITERWGWVLARPVRDRRTRVEWSEKKWRSPMFGRKVCVVRCVRGLLPVHPNRPIRIVHVRAVATDDDDDSDDVVNSLDVVLRNCTTIRTDFICSVYCYLQ